MFFRARRIGVVAALACLGACGPFHHGSAPVDPVIIFINESPDQADVYAVNGTGNSVRIGTVFAGRRETLKVPLSVLGGSHSVDIVARIFASTRTVHSGQVTLDAGESLEIRLPVDERLLSVLPGS